MSATRKKRLTKNDKKAEQTQNGGSGFFCARYQAVISHMRAHGVKLDDYTYMSDPDNANKVLGALSPNEGDRPSMPSGGPYWTAAQLELFAQWQKDGYQP